MLTTTVEPEGTMRREETIQKSSYPTVNEEIRNTATDLARLVQALNAALNNEADNKKETKKVGDDT